MKHAVSKDRDASIAGAAPYAAPPSGGETRDLRRCRKPPRQPVDRAYRARNNP